MTEHLAQFRNLKLKYCGYGWMLYSDSLIGTCFDLYGQYSESEVSLMRQCLRVGSTVIDVGANIGDLTVPLARVVGENGRVYAIESHPELFNVLCANLALNNLRNTKPINAFVAARENVATASRGWGKYSYVGEIWKPQYVALDSIDAGACDLIKVDVDGREYDVLQSGEMLIEKHRPILYFENDVRESSPRLLVYVVETLGYNAYWHLAPVFDEDNFFGNPVNRWAPKDMASVMVVGVPKERKCEASGLQAVRGKDDWPASLMARA